MADLAQACVNFVQRALGIALDYEPETLPLLDHYLAAARGSLESGDGADASLEVVAQAAGAYLGEVVRRRHPSWWRLSDNPEHHRLEFAQVYLTLRPVALVVDALMLSEGQVPDALEGMDLEESDREAALARLSLLPEVPLEEYVAPSTRVEVLDIVIEAARANGLAQGDASLLLEPSDYDD